MSYWNDLKDRTCIFFTMATVLMALPKLYLLRWYLDLGFGFRSSGYQDTRKLTGLSPEESPDDLQINHQIRVEAHLVA